MTPALAPRDDVRATRLLRIDPRTGRLAAGSIGDLERWLRDGDLLACNDAATLPASLQGTARGQRVEIRLAGERPDGSTRAVVFGAGDWRQRTEDRAPPPRLRAGDEIAFDGLAAAVVAVDAAHPRLVALRFDRAGAPLWLALYRAARPVQYSYLRRPLAVYDVQTAFAGRPWAVEPPSAALPLGVELLLALRRRGVAFARVTHAAGLSSTGDPALDARLPFAERFEVPAATRAAIDRTRAGRGRVVAVGTTVARALESAAGDGGRWARTEGFTDLRLGPAHRPRVTDGIVTGMHEPGTSHFALLEAFAPRDVLLRANAEAERLGYLAHEFGDALLVLAS